VAVLTVRYFASARAAAGLDEEDVTANNVAEALLAIRARHGERLARILDVSSLLLDGQVLREPHPEVGARAQLDVLPPFAGG
jgi:molybdopterin synthase sulfur carrier subunit